MITTVKYILFIIAIEIYLNQNHSHICNGEWVLKWSDHFTKNTFNKSLWRLLNITNGNTCLDNYPEVKDHKLILSIERSTHETCKLKGSKWIQSTVGWTYGKMDINASVEHNNAVAYILMYPIVNIYDTLYKHSGGFIDILRHDNEHLVEQTKITSYGIRYGNYSSDQTNLDKEIESELDYGFHLFSFEWNQTDMIWRIDGRIVFRVFTYKYFKLSNDEIYRKKGEPFDQPFYLTLMHQFYMSTDYSDIHDDFTHSSFIIDSVNYFKWIGIDSKDVSMILEQTTDAEEEQHSCSYLYYIIGFLVFFNALTLLSIFLYKTIYMKRRQGLNFKSIYNDQTQAVELLDTN